MTKSYIQLNRTFSEYRPGQDHEDLAHRSYVQRVTGKLICWDALLKHKRVVILGEAGSGKTTEFEEQIHQLEYQGKAAFFIRLESLAENGLEDSFSDLERNKFEGWKANPLKNAYFFLDSVDESRLNSFNSFELALKKFSQSLESRASHAHVIISSRITEWRGIPDSELISRLLPFQRNEQQKPARNKNKQAKPGDQTGTSEVSTVRVTSEKNISVTVVELSPLDDQQIHSFASAFTNTPEAFLKSVKEQDFQAFLCRPNDVLLLLSYWEQYGGFGSITDLLEFNISNKLKESNPAHYQTDTLDATRARFGAEILAAALVFSRKNTLIHPDSANTPGLFESIDPQKVLPDWKSGDIRALFTRSLFDGAAFGKVRFHHRTTKEFLAACWLKRLTEANLPYVKLRNLLFKRSHDLVFIPASLAPIAAWLAATNPKIRQEVMKVDPSILLAYGDSVKIPLDERRTLLNVLAERDAGRMLDYVDKTQLKRLSHIDLVPNLLELLIEPSQHELLKTLILSIIQAGRQTSCSESVYCLAIAPETSLNLRIAAIETLRQIGSLIQVSQVITSRIMEQPSLSLLEAKTLAECFYPLYLNHYQFLTLLAIAEPAPAGFFDHFGFALRQIGEQLAENEVLGFIQVLTQHSQHVFSKSREHFNPEQCYWVYRPLLSALQRFLGQKQTHANHYPDILSALAQLELLKKLSENQYHESTFLPELQYHPELRQQLFWLTLERLRQKPNHKDEQINDYHFTEVQSHLALNSEDLTWLITQAKEAPKPENRKVAFQVAVFLCIRKPNPAHKKQLMALCRTNKDFKDIWKKLNPGIHIQYWFHLTQTIRNLYLYPSLTWKPRFYAIKRKWEHIHVGFTALKHLQALLTEPPFWILYNLVFCAARNTTYNQYSDYPTEHLTNAWPGLGFAVRKGLKLYWKRWCSTRPSWNQGTRATELALIGIKVDLEENSNICSFSEEHMLIALSHSLHELNQPPAWVNDIALCKPNLLRRVYPLQIRDEYNLPTNSSSLGLLQKLCYYPSQVSKVLSEDVLNLLKNADPMSPAILNQSLIILQRERPSCLLPLAESRTELAITTGHTEHAVEWLATLLKLDALPGLDFLDNRLSNTTFEQGKELVIHLASRIYGEEKYSTESASEEVPSYRSLPALKRLVPLLYRFVLPRDDLIREGVYSPGRRDNAQDFRNACLNWLIYHPDSGAYEAILEVSNLPALVNSKDWLLAEATKRARVDAEAPAWSAEDIAKFSDQFERMPKTADELMEIVLGRLEDIRQNAEHGDFSWHKKYPKGTREEIFQRDLADKLETVSQNVYQVAREVEVVDHKKPDIRLYLAGVGYITIEIKVANSWTYNELDNALKTQLVGQYLRAPDSKHGILLLINLNPTKTWHPTNSKGLTYTALLEKLESEANSLMIDRENQIHVSVLGFNIQPLVVKSQEQADE